MTREEIKYASKDYVNYLLDKQEYHNENYTEYDIRQAFEKGAMLAYNNPDLLSLWHDAKEMPNYGSAYIAIDNNNHIWICEKSLIISQTLWADIASAQKIYKWIYIADILPKGGDK